MSASTLRLHTALIRLVKGMVSAWEAWVAEQQAVQSIKSS